MTDKNIFETSNVDLGAFLLLEGIPFIECKKASQEVIVMCFSDEKKNCRDLERVFMGSEYKRYRDFNKYLLKEIHSKLREKKNG